MKMFIWNASSGCHRFGNFYGESMLCILAKTITDALSMIKEKDYYLWLSIINKPSLDYHGAKVNPEIYQPLVENLPFINESKTYFDKWVVDGRFNESKSKDFHLWKEKLNNELDLWFNENILKEDGTSEFMFKPIEVDMTQPQYFYTKAED